MRDQRSKILPIPSMNYPVAAPKFGGNGGEIPESALILIFFETGRYYRSIA
jgi:hypothetical protein